MILSEEHILAIKILCVIVIGIVVAVIANVVNFKVSKLINKMKKNERSKIERNGFGKL